MSDGYQDVQFATDLDNELVIIWFENPTWQLALDVESAETMMAQLAKRIKQIKERLMGVLNCARTGCDNIMCDQIVYECYICDECLEEFRTTCFNERGDCEYFKGRFMQFMDRQQPIRIGDTVEDFLDIWMKKR